MTAIDARNLSKVYRMGSGYVKAVDDITLQIEQGEFVSVVGPSGSGKSTLLRLLATLEEPTNGSIHIHGENVDGMDSDRKAIIRNRYIGFVFQSYNLIPSLNACENAALPLFFRGVDRYTSLKTAKRILDIVGLGNRSTHFPAQLSGGQQQRVSIARALITDPPIIMADEPTGNLDSKSGREIIDLLIDFIEDTEKVLLLVTHDNEIVQRAKRTIRITDGRIVRETKV